MSQYNKWENGVFLTFDFPINDLKKYYSYKSPQNAYTVIRKYLVKNGFEALGDSDYRNYNIDKLQTLRLLNKFSKNNKWFPFCLDKLDIAPNLEKLDVSPQIKLLGDETFKNLKEKEYKQISKTEKNSNNTLSKKGKSHEDYLENLDLSEQLNLLIKLKEKIIKEKNINAEKRDKFNKLFEDMKREINKARDKKETYKELEEDNELEL